MCNNPLYTQLQNIKFSTFLFNIRPDEEIILSKFVGTTIRGGFGYSFKKAVCLFKDKKDCSECVLSHDCPYSLLFESKLQHEDSSLKASEIPRPYIFDTSHSYKQIYTKDEIFSLQLTLIGRAIKYLPYFFLSVQKLGESGFGQNE
jgi:CRISPR/Cas system endoribonuclease Cas6 (RAMP superfamily)